MASKVVDAHRWARPAVLAAEGDPLVSMVLLRGHELRVGVVDEGMIARCAGFRRDPRHEDR